MDEMKSTRSLGNAIRSGREAGMTLVELMVVVAIVAIIAAVATPAYVNYVNRVKQSEAASLLLTAKLEMEEFFADNNRYAERIGCLPSFTSSDSAERSRCLANCLDCTTETHKARWYTYSISAVGASSYTIAATRKVYSYAPDDRLVITSSSQTPDVPDADSPNYALKFSVYKWLFEN